jgi:TrmH family RNA methyltransferase
MAASTNKSIELYLAADDLFKKLCDTKTPEGVLAVCEKPSYTIRDIFEKPGKKLFILLDSVSDPGNLGTIIRSADNFGAAGIFITHDSVYEYSGKVIRSSMGSFKNVPVLRICDKGYDILAGAIRDSGTLVVSSELGASSPIGDIGKHLAGRNFKNILLVAGSESHGIKTPELLELMKKSRGLIQTKIPCRGRNESLNLSMAVSIYCYELDKYLGK